MSGKSVFARVERIAEKLRTVRERGLEPFGLEGHRWESGPPLPEREVSAFEVRHGVRLPEGYRAFLTRIGDGGAGPAYGMYRLEQSLTVQRQDVPEGFLRVPFMPTQPVLDPVKDPFWEDQWERVDRGELAEGELKQRLLMLEAGTLVLCHEGCGYLHLLVVTGPTRGEMWLDARCSDGGIVPLRVDFLEWYERWLDSLLAGGRGTWWLEPAPAAG